MGGKRINELACRFDEKSILYVCILWLFGSPIFESGDIQRIFCVFGRYGGMPSAHVATTSALAWAVGYTTGFDSPLTAIAAIFLAITTADAVGLRRNVDPNKGHTLMEAIYGFLLGWIVALLTVKLYR